MVRYCPECGRSIPLDAQICPYCGKSIGLHRGLITTEPEKKKDKTVLIIVVLLVLFLVVPVVIAATVYVYVSGMLPEASHFSSTPNISFTKNETANTLLVTYVESSSVRWSDIQIQGNCNTSALGIYVHIGDTITDCSGSIILYYKTTGQPFGTWTFT